MENDGDDFAQQRLTRKQQGANKRKDNRQNQRSEGGRKIHRVGESKERWHWDKHSDYQIDE